MSVYGAAARQIDHVIRFDDLDVASLLKNLHDAVNTFGITDREEVSETHDIGRINEDDGFRANISVVSRRDAAERIASS